MINPIQRFLILVLLCPSLALAHDGPPLWLLPALPYFAIKKSLNRSAIESVSLSKKSEVPLLTPQGLVYGVRINYQMNIGKDLPAGMNVIPNCQVVSRQGTTRIAEDRLFCSDGAFTNAKGVKQVDFSEDNKTPAGVYHVSYDIIPNGLQNKENTSSKCLQIHAFDRYFEGRNAGLARSLTEKLSAMRKMPNNEESIELAFTYRATPAPLAQMPNSLIATKINPITLVLNASVMGISACP